MNVLQLDSLPTVDAALPGAGGVDLWLASGELASDALDADERLRAARLIDLAQRELFVRARALLRHAISHYTGVAPADWRFAADANGKPHIARPVLSQPLSFSVSHVRGLVVCAVSRLARVGVDAEDLARELDWPPIARQHFAPEEWQALHALPADKARRAFFEHWVLKESLLKASGLGLTLPLADVRVGHPPCLVHAPPALRPVDAWRVALIEATPHHLVAVAADTGGASLSLRALSLA